MDLLSPTHGLGRLREDCTTAKHQEIEVNTSWTDYTLVKHRLRNSTMRGADTDSENNVLVVKMCTKLNKIIQFQKGKPV